MKIKQIQIKFFLKPKEEKKFLDWAKKCPSLWEVKK